MDEECKRVKLYYTSVAGTLSLKKSQIHIEDVLTAKHISFEKIDVSAPESEDKKTFMKENASGPGGKTPLPPQIFLEDEYCGDYEAFSEALEDDCLEVFLKLAKPSEVSQAEVTITGGKDRD